MANRLLLTDEILEDDWECFSFVWSIKHNAPLRTFSRADCIAQDVTEMELQVMGAMANMDSRLILRSLELEALDVGDSEEESAYLSVYYSAYHLAD